MAQKLDVRYINFYTAGSAAYKVSPVQPLKLLRLPKAKKRKTFVLHIDPVATAGIFVSIVMLISMLVGVVQLKTAQQKVETMSAYVQELRAENTRLTAIYESGYDLEDVRETALAMGMVPKEQVKHVALQMPEEIQPEQPSIWNRFYTFLTGLFA